MHAHVKSEISELVKDNFMDDWGLWMVVSAKYMRTGHINDVSFWKETAPHGFWSWQESRIRISNLNFQPNIQSQSYCSLFNLAKETWRTTSTIEIWDFRKHWLHLYLFSHVLVFIFPRKTLQPGGQAILKIRLNIVLPPPTNDFMKNNRDRNLGDIIMRFNTQHIKYVILFE